MKIKPRKIKAKQFAVVYRGNGKYAVFDRDIGTRRWWYNENLKYTTVVHEMPLESWISISHFPPKFLTNLKETQIFEQKRLLLEEINIYLQADKLISKTKNRKLWLH